jgi:hypothetical protein
MVALGVLLAVASPVVLPAQATDPASGTWELNLAKSKFTPGPPPKSQTRTWEISGQSVKYTMKGVDAQGKPVLVQYAASYDGKDYPITGTPDSDMISFKRVDATTVQFTQKRAGKVVITGTRVVSKDGKVLTVTSSGTNAAGQSTSSVMVFEKR